MPESEREKRERQQREREAMKQAVAAYTGPITKCPRASRLTCCAGDEHKTNRKRQEFEMLKTGAISSSISAECVLTTTAAFPLFKVRVARPSRGSTLSPL